ncbi:MAG: hypothetical protein H6Q48_4841, partial [Deltaproteobacteria bacterium]|nr:hypothetical protein [Deltaproteobacteria bacterium]
MRKISPLDRAHGIRPWACVRFRSKAALHY